MASCIPARTATVSRPRLSSLQHEQAAGAQAPKAAGKGSAQRQRVAKKGDNALLAASHTGSGGEPRYAATPAPSMPWQHRTIVHHHDSSILMISFSRVLCCINSSPRVDERRRRLLLVLLHRRRRQGLCSGPLVPGLPTEMQRTSLVQREREDGGSRRRRAKATLGGGVEQTRDTDIGEKIQAWNALPAPLCYPLSPCPLLPTSLRCLGDMPRAAI
nr:unnamed protein product [Digitaria exilis]